MKYLSFKYDWKFMKEIGLLVNGLLIIFAIAFLIIILTVDFIRITYHDKIIGIVFLVLFIIYGFIHFYYLLISVDIKYNESDLFIKIDGKWKKIPIINVLKIKRTFYFYYTIELNKNNILQKSRIVYLIPNPNFWRDKKVKEVLSFAEEQRKIYNSKKEL